MSLIWHIVRKDLFRVRWILALWLAVIIGGLVMAALQAIMDERQFYPFYLGAVIFSLFFSPVIAFGLVAGLIHDDSVSGGDAFWVTRPISGGQLLAAKSVVLAGFCCLPVLAAIPWWLAHGYGVHELFWSATDVFRFQLLVSLVAWPIAVLSVNTSRFVLYTILLAVAAALVLLLAMAISSWGRGGASGPAKTVADSRALVVVGIWAATSLIVTLNQFLRRRIGKSRMIFGIGVTLALIAAAGWRTPLSYRLRIFSPPTTAEWSSEALASTAQAVALEAGDRDVAMTESRERDDLQVVARVSAEKGSRVAQKGFTLAVQDTLLEFTGAYLMSVSETQPDWVSASYQMYFLVNPEDGRFLVGQVKPWGEFSVASVRHSHVELTFRPTGKWPQSSRLDFATWLKGASLVKVAPRPVADL